MSLYPDVPQIEPIPNPEVRNVNLRIAIRSAAIRAGLLRHYDNLTDEQLILLLQNVGDLAYAAQQRFKS